jgi:hypothetical protein
MLAHPRLSLVSRSRRAPSSSCRCGRLRDDPRTSTSWRSRFEGAERPQASSPRNASARLQALYIAAVPIVTLTASGRTQLEPERGVRSSCGSGTCPSWESEVLRLQVPQTRVPSKTCPLRYRPARRFPSRAGHLGWSVPHRRPPHLAHASQAQRRRTNGETDAALWRSEVRALSEVFSSSVPRSGDLTRGRAS